MELGNNVSIHPMCYIDAAGGIKIGSNVSIAHSTTLISTNHTWDNVDLPIKYNPETFAEIIIEDDVWIGCGVRILAGVKIRRRSVVAAGAVVNKSFDNNALIGGVPAKFLKAI
ncbi:acyltransferase [Kaistella haifensis]|nr:acyltransferase [Kaistella haifensis]